MINLAKELREIVADEYKNAIDDILTKENVTTNAEVILQLCKIITSQIDIVIHKRYFPWINGMGNVYNRKTELLEEDENKLMIYGTQLIYLLRTFIHDEEITFHMASKSADGKYSASAFIPQSQILTSLSATSKTAIGVSKILQKELIVKNQTNELFNIKRKNMWSRVEYLSEARYITGRNINKIDMRKNGAKRAHWAYQSQKKDNQVYLKFSGKQYIKYYDMNNSGSRESLMNFNNGWLWEWYNKILYGSSDEQYNEANQSLLHGSLRPIMLGPDWTPGTKEGDFQDLQGRQIQSKYANTKIISYNNIRHIIYDLEIALTQYLEEGKNAENKLINVLNEHFFPESANIGNAFANDIANNLLKKFDAKI